MDGFVGARNPLNTHARFYRYRQNFHQILNKKMKVAIPHSIGLKNPQVSRVRHGVRRIKTIYILQRKQLPKSSSKDYIASNSSWCCGQVSGSAGSLVMGQHFLFNLTFSDIWKTPTSNSWALHDKPPQLWHVFSRWKEPYILHFFNR